MNIVDFLPVGEENAITMTELAVLLGCSKREARALIFEARCRGAVICSTADPVKGGYYLPRTDDEIKRFLMFAQHRVNSTLEAIKSAKKFLKKGGFSKM
ncbi:MAG: hypothetical protein IKH96_09080 [Ruminococcus sp.]|uniref:hypothetical protein n=1 Tax=Ruminococcus sp. TaxID=41978 RepID=UPI0025D7D816|nr:hypothetical protein [Ruminococcus sp.]MBR6996155.1 hypothetical protein [Ruminococcus sp.]